MLTIVLVSVASILIPLSLCLVPSFARWTIFPMLNQLIHCYASTYVLPTLRLEYAIGSFRIRSRRDISTTTAYGVTLSLSHVSLHPAYLRAFAFSQKGIAPLLIRAMTIEKISLKLVSSWRVVLEISGIDIHTVLLKEDAGTDDDSLLFSVKDAVSKRIADAIHLLAPLCKQKEKESISRSQKLSYTERIFQQVLAQIDVSIHQLNCHVGKAMDIADTVTCISTPTAENGVLLRVNQLDIRSDIEHDNTAIALEQVMYATDIRVRHAVHLHEAQLILSDTNGVMLHLPAVTMEMNAPPIARVLRLGANVEHIPLEQRTCRVHLSLPSNDLHSLRLNVCHPDFICVMDQYYRPYANYQSIVSVRCAMARDRVTQQSVTREERDLYENLLQSKPSCNPRLLEDLRGKLNLDELLQVYFKHFGLDIHFGKSHEQIGRREVVTLVNEIASRPVNIMWSTLEISFSINNDIIVACTKDGNDKTGELVTELRLCGVEGQVDTWTRGDENKRLLKRMCISMERLEWTVDESAKSKKLVSTDFTTVSDHAESVVPKLIQIEAELSMDGHQAINSKLYGLQLIADASALQSILYFIDRMVTDLGSIIAQIPPRLQTDVVGDPEASQTRYSFALLHGALLDINVALQGCRTIFLPSSSFAMALFTEKDLPHQDACIIVPLDFCCAISSTLISEEVRVCFSNLSFIAHYMSGVEEFILSPTAILLTYSLQEEQTCHFHISLEMSPWNWQCSDLSFTLINSCRQELSCLEIITPEHAKQRFERIKSIQRKQYQTRTNLLLDRVKHQFEAIDENHDHHISPHEFLTFLQHDHVGHMLLVREVEILGTRWFQQMDQDADGKIDFQELREYISLDDGSGSTGVDSVSIGQLNLKGYDYVSWSQIEEWSGTKVENMTQLPGILSTTVFQSRFWEAYTTQLQLPRTRLDGKSLLTVQKQLVRLVGHYEATFIIWERLLVPSLDDDEVHDWMLKPGMLCGGLSEFTNVSRILIPLEESSSCHPISAIEKKHLKISTTWKLNPVRIVWGDPELPLDHNRGEMVVDNINLSIEALLGDIEPYSPMNWRMILPSESSEWTVLSTFCVTARAYNELANQMECIIEAWTLAAALSSSVGEKGVAVLMEVENPIQVNITPSLLRIYRVLIGEASVQHSLWIKHQEGYHCMLLGSTRESKRLVLSNQTASAICIGLQNQFIELKPQEEICTSIQTDANDSIRMDTLRIDGFGAFEGTSLRLPTVGSVNVHVTDTTRTRTLLVTVYCRIPSSRLVLKSNFYVCNHSSVQKYDLQYSHQDTLSSILSLGPQERIALPLPLLMEKTQLFTRPIGRMEWTMQTTIQPSIFTNSTAIQAIKEYKLTSMEPNGIVLQSLTPTLIARRIHLRTHVEFEISIVPPLVIRNVLPYTIKYRYVEYTIPKKEMGKQGLEQVIDLLETSTQLLSGQVASGQIQEIIGISCLVPGYMSVCLVSMDGKSTTGWSPPLLMAIHTSIAQFTMERQLLLIDQGISIAVDRSTMPLTPRLVRFSCPYWIFNHTAIEIAMIPAFKGKDSDLPSPIHPAFSNPRLMFLDDDRICFKSLQPTHQLPRSWDSLGRVAKWTISEHETMGTWTKPINCRMVHTVGECVSGSTVLGVQIEGLYGVFEQTTAITLSPRYVIKNQLKQSICIDTFASCLSIEQTETLFQQRSIQPTRVIESGESAPLCIFPLISNAGEGQEKLISIALSGPTLQWSPLLCVQNPTEMFLTLYSPSEKQFIICQVTIALIDMHIYIVLENATTSPPYRIENYTEYTIECKQVHEESSHLLSFRSTSTSLPRPETHYQLESGQWKAFAWFHPVVKGHILEITVNTVENKNIKHYRVDIDQVGSHPSIQLDGIELMVQTVIEQGTRVVQLRHEISRDEECSIPPSFLHASSCDIRIAGIGISLFDVKSQEVTYFSMDQVQLLKASASFMWQWTIFHAQIDNMLLSAQFPVVLNPLQAGLSATSTTDGIIRPWIQVVVEIDETSSAMGIYKLVSVEWGRTALKIDVDYLFLLLRLIEPFVTTPESTGIVHRVLTRCLPRVPTLPKTKEGRLIRNVVYAEVLRINALVIEVEYVIRRKEIVSSTTTTHPSIFSSFISQIIGLIGSNLSGSPTFTFSEMIILRCFTTKQRLQSLLIQHFKREALLQAYRIVGSVDVLGNPIGFIEDLGTGVMEFLKITKDEVSGETNTRGEGVKVLGKTVVKTGASTLAKITGSLDRLVGELGQQDDQQGEENPSMPRTGVAPIDGSLQFAKDLGKGITGIFTKPVEGAKKGGVTGLVQGTVQGLTGPGVVLLKQLTSTSHTLALGVQSTVVDRSPFGGRRRLPKSNIGYLVADPNNQSRPTRLVLEVIGCQGLVGRSSCNPYCTVRLDDKTILTTRVLYNTVNPTWYEKIQVELVGNESRVVLNVYDSIGQGALDQTIGTCCLLLEKLRLDFKPPAFKSSLSQWVHTGIQPSHDLKKQNKDLEVKEKQYTLLVNNENSASTASKLLGLGTSGRLKATTDDVQVVITIASLQDLISTSVNGGGLLGLGNWGGKSKLSPYVLIHVNNQDQQTNTSKVTYKGEPLKGTSEWNETFTFTLSRTEQEVAILLSLKDRSVLMDETIAYGQASLVLDATPEPLMQEVTLYRYKFQQGDVVGKIRMNVEIIEATLGTSKKDVKKEGEESGETAMGRSADVLKAGKIRIACSFA